MTIFKKFRKIRVSKFEDLLEERDIETIFK
jgi:hypothetical protein